MIPTLTWRGRAYTAALALAATLSACDSMGGPLDADPTEMALLRGADRSAEINRQLAELRRVTAPFHTLEKAFDAGYRTQITTCWGHVAHGGQGYHYGSVDLIEDGVVSALEPELLMYEPQAGGHLRLVGVEYIVPIALWEGPPPVLFGQQFQPHSFLPIYKLHVWLWRDNLSGAFADWNPSVSCMHAEESEIFE